MPLVLGASAAIALTRRSARTVLCGVALLSCCAGTIVGRTAAEPGALVEIARSVPRCDLEGRVIERAGGLGTLLDVTLTTCGGMRGVAVATGAIGEPGASVVGNAWVLSLGDDPFERARWHAGARVQLVGDVHVVRPPEAPLLRAAARVRGLLRAATDSLPDDRAGLLLGLTIGETDRLTPATVDAFRRSGLAHLVAVSGSNVALVLGAAAVLARHRARRTRLVVSGVTLALYVLVVGPDASVLRAAGMAALMLIAVAFGRSAISLSTLAVALIAIVLLRPGMVFSAGFHLSVAATLGIILLAPAIARIMPGPRWFSLLLGATLGAQVGVAPVLLATFGELSLIAPVANLLAAPAVAVTTITGLVGGLCTGLVPQLAPMITALADAGVRWILNVAELTSRIPGASVALPAQASLIAAAVAIAAAWWARKVSTVTSFVWAVLDASGAEIERTEVFATKDEAEAWMGSEWATLLGRGGESVELYEGDRRHYRMGLREA